MDKQKKAYIYALLTVLCWSTSASAFKISLNYLAVPPLLLYASIASGAVLLLHLLLSGKISILRTFSRQDYLRSALLGLLNPFLYYVVVLSAYSLLPAQQAQPINFVWPITLVLLSAPLLKQKIRPRDILATFICFAGVVVISTKGNVLSLHFESPFGVILALGSTVIWSLFWIYNVKDTRDEVAALFLNFAFATVYILLATLLLGQMHLPGLRGLLGATYIGLFEMGIAFIFWLKALKLSKTTAHLTNLIYLVPFFSLVLVSLVVGETIHFSTITGLILQKL